MISKLKNTSLNIALTLLVIILVLAVFELVLSTTCPADSAASYDPEMFKENAITGKIVPEGDTPYRPYANVIFDGSPGMVLNPTSVKINSQGLRDYEYCIEKPNNTFRILGFGDSFTWGHGVELNETYLKKLETKLNALNSTLHYEVINFGVAGFGTNQSINLLKMKGLDYKPDIVVLLCSHNDIKFYSNDMDLNPCRKKPYTGLRTITWIKCKLTQSKIYPNRFYEAIDLPLAELSRMSEENNFTVILLCPFFEYKNLATEHNFFFTTFELDKSQKLKDDHPNPFGHEIIAEKLYYILIDKNLIQK